MLHLLYIYTTDLQLLHSESLQSLTIITTLEQTLSLNLRHVNKILGHKGYERNCTFVGKNGLSREDAMICLYR